MEKLCPATVCSFLPLGNGKGCSKKLYATVKTRFLRELQKVTLAIYLQIAQKTIYRVILLGVALVPSAYWMVRDLAVISLLSLSPPDW